MLQKTFSHNEKVIVKTEAYLEDTKAMKLSLLKAIIIMNKEEFCFEVFSKTISKKN